MKRVVCYFIALAFIIVSCTPQKSDFDCGYVQSNIEFSSDSIGCIAELKSKELKSGKRIHKIFLDYAFGMTKNEVLSHTRELLNKDKIYKVSGLPAFEVTFNKNNKYELVYAPKYYNGKLYRLILMARAKDVSYHGSSQVGLTAIQMVIILGQTYGFNDYVIKDYSNGNELYGWVNGNLQIKIIPETYFVQIEYTNIITARKLKENKKQKAKKKQNKI